MFWVDVKPTDWFYNEIMEASRIKLEDGSPFIQGIPYGVFKNGSPYIYEEHIGVTGKKKFLLSTYVNPTVDNPLNVYIDGVQTVYKALRTVDGKTEVELYVAPKQGSIISFISEGIPLTDRFGKPVTNSIPAQYPSYKLSKGDKYFYNPFSRKYQEYVYAFGKMLMRASVDDSEWGISSVEDILKKYIGYKNDVYVIEPYTGTIYMPYILNNVTCRITYSYLDGYEKQITEVYKPSSPSVVFTNRFFPNAYITRAEAYTLINRLRQTFYSRFTDIETPTNVLDQTIVAYEGQRIFKLNGTYPAKENLLVVTVNGELKNSSTDYVEFDEHTVIFNQGLKQGDEVHFLYEKTQSRRFADVNGITQMIVQNTGEVVTINGLLDSWWAGHVLSIEDEKLKDGTYLIEGINVTNFDTEGRVVVDNMYNNIPGTNEPVRMFMPYSLLTRAQAVAFLNRFRKWCIEKFKL